MPKLSDAFLRRDALENIYSELNHIDDSTVKYLVFVVKGCMEQEHFQTSPHLMEIFEVFLRAVNTPEKLQAGQSLKNIIEIELKTYQHGE